MDINITDSERDFLVELLDTRYRSILHELHHTDTYDYKQLLSHQLDLLEKVRDKLKTAPAQQGQEEKASTS